MHDLIATKNNVININANSFLYAVHEPNYHVYGRSYLVEIGVHVGGSEVERSCRQWRENYGGGGEI